MAPTIGVNLRVTGNCNRGGRGHMEDMFSVAYQPTFDGTDLEYAFFGIFDGHGGKEAAQYAKDHLLKNIVSQHLFWSNSDSDICTAIEKGFLRTHYGMWKDLENWPKTVTGLPSTSGTTASIVFVKRSTIFVGHAGDSGIVLGQKLDDSKWVATRLTEDHKPENTKEAIRISQAGGQVVKKGGVPRVVWRRVPASHQGPTTRSTQYERVPFLAIARSLGDLWSYNEDTDEFVVSPVPDIDVRSIDVNRDKCIILGTDGLFNMMSASEAVAIIQEVEHHNKTLKENPQNRWMNPSKVLVDHAIAKWNSLKIRADNTSAVVLLMDPLGPPHDIKSKQIGSTHSYTIESYKTRDADNDKIVSGGMAICTLTEKVEKIPYCAKPWTTLKGLTRLFGDDETPPPSPPKTKASLVHLEDLKKIKRETFQQKRGEKRKLSKTTNRDHSEAPAPKKPRLSAPDEPVATSSKETNKKSEVAHIQQSTPSESDAENLDAPMKLRSAVPFKTLRSRNVNLDVNDKNVNRRSKGRQKTSLARTSLAH